MICNVMICNVLFFRSDCVFSIHVEQKSIGGSSETGIRSKITLIDMAGIIKLQQTVTNKKVSLVAHKEAIEGLACLCKLLKSYHKM